MPKLTVRKLTPGLLQDYLHYFDHVGFSDNADWAACYCLYYHFQHDTAKWAERIAEQNRSTISDLINHDQHHGYLAYVDNQIAGWCHAAPRIELYALLLQVKLKVDDAEQVGSIVCFNVAPDRRGQGV